MSLTPDVIAKSHTPAVNERRGQTLRVNAKIRKLLQLPDIETFTPTTVEETIAKQLIQKAVNGDLRAIRELLDRVDGKPAQTIISTPVVDLDLNLTDEQLKEIINAD